MVVYWVNWHKSVCILCLSFSQVLPGPESALRASGIIHGCMRVRDVRDSQRS